MFVGVFLSLVSVCMQVQKASQALSLGSKLEIDLLFGNLFLSPPSAVSPEQCCKVAAAISAVRSFLSLSA